MPQRTKFPDLKGNVTEQTKYYGVYRAHVINNNDPLGVGRIQVHIYVRDGPLSYDTSTHQWVPVLSPYGGLAQMGLFDAPPIGAEGYVTFEAGFPSQPVWVGTFASFNTSTLNQAASDAAGYGVIQVQPTIPPEIGTDASRIVWKTQNTTAGNIDPTSNANPVENIMLMDNTQFTIQHVNQSVYQYSPGGITTGTPGSYITLADTSITIGVLSADNKRYELTVSDTGITLKTNDGGQIIMLDGFIKIMGIDTTQIQILAQSNGSVDMEAKTVLLDGQQIILGQPGSQPGGGVLTTSTIDPFTGIPSFVGSSKVIASG
jgi:hypothetical protein